MMLADRLKKSVYEIMELTTLELNLWSAWIKREQDATNKQMRRTAGRGNSTKSRY